MSARAQHRSTGDRRPPRFLLYSHDAVGLGHIRRNLTLATAVTSARPDASVLLVTGAEELETFSIPQNVDVVRLPGVRKSHGGAYAARRLCVPDDDVRELRSALLATLVERFGPDVLLADKHPTGLRGELDDALRCLHALGGRAALGLRDVLDDPRRTREEWAASGALDHVVAHHDRVLVYGQAGLLDPFDGCVVPRQVRARTRFCGYVVAEAEAESSALPARRQRPMVVAMAGGGEDGAPLLRCFLASSKAGAWQAVAVTGPQLAGPVRDELSELARRCGAEVLTSVRDLGCHIGAADAVVCMGGYNTISEVLAAGVPAVCVPRVHPRVEQLIRARALAARGLVRLVEPSGLTPQRLGAQIDAALQTDRRALGGTIRATVDLGGARRAAAELVALAVTSRPVGGAEVLAS